MLIAYTLLKYKQCNVSAPHSNRREACHNKNTSRLVVAIYNNVFQFSGVVKISTVKKLSICETQINNRKQEVGSRCFIPLTLTRANA